MIAGVDGCKGGWIAVLRAAAAPARAMIFATFAELVDALPVDATIAVDMPIGLPERAGLGGRGPEALVRPVLGERQSSVFTIPSRAAVYAEPGPFASDEDRYMAHRRACTIALATSDPPRKFSIQAFGLVPKIRELDVLLLARPDLRRRIVESHPEVAFWQLNGEKAMSLPKKVKGRINPAGMAERRALLVAKGFDAALLARPPPSGAGEDDYLDACVMLLVAERVRAGVARSFPDPPIDDERGISLAIRV